MRSASVLVPRRASQESIGPGTAPAAFAMNWMRSARSSSFSTQIPPIMSLWPLRYFVVEWNTMFAPYSSGRWKNGVANVLSTTSSTPRVFAIAAAAARSVSRMSGFVGVSSSIATVFGVMAPSIFCGSRVSTNENDMPKFVRILSNSRYVPPYTFSPQTM